MNKLFKRIIRIGITPELSLDRVDEIKVMNSIKVHGFLAVSLSCVGASFLLPEHARFFFVLALTHSIATVSIMLLHSLGEHRIAKTIFVFDPALLVTMILVYFGTESNLQYVSLILLFTYVFIFRRGDWQDLQLIVIFAVLTAISVAYIHFGRISLVKLTFEEMDTVRVVVYILAFTLSSSIGFIMYQNSLSRRRSLESTIRVSMRDATILQTISANMEDGVFKSSKDDGLVYVNQSFVKMFGYESVEDILRTHPVNLYPSKADRDSLFMRIEKSGKVANSLLQYRKKDGSHFWGRVSTTKIEEEGEELVIGTVTDVTIQQAQDEVIKENEQRLREAQSFARLGNWEMGVRSKKMTWSEQSERVHGFKTNDDENAYSKWIRCLETVTEKEVDAAIAHCLLMNEAYEFGTWYNSPFGERRYLHYICLYKHGNQDQEDSWYGTVQDITQQKEQEQEIISTREFYHKVLNLIPIEAVIIASDRTYQFISENAIADDELRTWLIGKHDRDYAEYRNLPLDFADERAERVDEAFRTGLTVRWEEKMQTRDGRETYHIRNLVPLKFPSGTGEIEKFLMGYSFDINDIKRAQMKLELNNKELNIVNQELDRFVYSISHDLRAPIASVLGLISLAEESESMEETGSLLKMQREALDRLDRYIRDVIDYSRNKRLEIDPVEIDLKNLIETCREELAYLPNYQGIEYFVNVEDGVSITTDFLRIKILFSNLYSNAIKYADPKKKSFVGVTISPNGDGIKIVFEDNGVGIKQEYIPKIWDMFFRGTSEGSGSGLGLYIMKEAVANIQGTIAADSSEGKGASFTIHLPNLS